MFNECETCEGRGFNVECRSCRHDKEWCRCSLDAGRWDNIVCDTCNGSGLHEDENKEETGEE
jgi:hypothetical protein